ncbi:MAG: hypothetical protein FWD69_19630 [Polyangiaceae bacterium]|nr:hypothetical protein [Polyangiaceae bacterium]
MDAKERQALAPFIRQVLQSASSGKGSRPHYLTSYQIVERLPAPERSTLIATYGRGGKGAGRADTAPAVIAKVLKHELAGEVDVQYMDVSGTHFMVDGQVVEAGYGVVGLYRLRDQEDSP